jgi:hypothetical protein
VAKGIRVTRDTLRSLRDNTAACRLTVSQGATEIFECSLRELAETAGLGSHQVPDHDAADRQALGPETDR